MGARDPERGRAAAEAIGARSVLLDVTDDDCVLAAAEYVRERSGHLDVLVNNAGVAGPRKEAADITVEDIEAVYTPNLFGAVRVTQAFLPLLQKSSAPAVVNVSSGLGSLAIAADPEQHVSHVPVYYASLGYNTSKAALNMLTVQYAKAFPGIAFNAVDPGWTATDLNGHTGIQTVEEGAQVIVRLAMEGGGGPTGEFFGNSGIVPW